ncbi:hypothetical protein HDU97_003657 [Phlyctochytrium planicorne]|nr:hypothetical protein HDU97_003657 [Phlyctochytrium planicorne]
MKTRELFIQAKRTTQLRDLPNEILSSIAVYLPKRFLSRWIRTGWCFSPLIASLYGDLRNRDSSDIHAMSSATLEKHGHRIRCLKLDFASQKNLDNLAKLFPQFAKHLTGLTNLVFQYHEFQLNDSVALSVSFAKALPCPEKVSSMVARFTWHYGSEPPEPWKLPKEFGEVLETFPNLRQLSLPRLEGWEVEILQHFQHLERLRLNDLSFRSETDLVKYVRCLLPLKRLHLDRMEWVDGYTASLLSQLQDSIEELSLSDCKEVDHEALEWIGIEELDDEGPLRYRDMDSIEDLERIHKKLREKCSVKRLLVSMVTDCCLWDLDCRTRRCNYTLGPYFVNSGNRQRIARLGFTPYMRRLHWK